MESEMLDYRQAARLCGLKVGTLYSMVARREIPHVRLGRRLVRFRRPSLLRWMADREVQPLSGTRGQAAAQ